MLPVAPITVTLYGFDLGIPPGKYLVVFAQIPCSDVYLFNAEREEDLHTSFD